MRWLPSILALILWGHAGSASASDLHHFTSLYRHRVRLRENAPAAPDVAQPAAALHEQATVFTPYDRWSGEVRTVVARFSHHAHSLAEVRVLMRTGNGFRYRRRDPLIADAPEVTEARRASDCKGKSLWLADQLGDASVRYVIGLSRQSAAVRHAWLYWNDGADWWILDCTNSTEPIRATDPRADRYIPYYSYAKSGTYRYRATALLLVDGATDLPAATVAAGR